MCSACGYPARAGHWTDAGLLTAHDRMRARLRRAEVLRRALRGYGLTVYDDGISDGLTLSTLSGASEIVLRPEDLWRVAERLAGRKIDVLNG